MKQKMRARDPQIVLTKSCNEEVRLFTRTGVRRLGRLWPFTLVFILAVSVFLTPATAQLLPTDARAVTTSARVSRPSLNGATVQRVGPVGMTVSDMDRAVEFYSKVLSFEKVSDSEVAGDDYERLGVVFGVRMKLVRMRLGEEFIELTEYLAPKGRPIPIDSRSNDRWFQHVAIITSDMEKAYAWLRENKVEHASTGPQRLSDWNKNAGGIKAFYFKDPDKHALEVLQLKRGRYHRLVRWSFILAATSRYGQDLWDATGLSCGGSRILLICLTLVNKERETPPPKAVASVKPLLAPW